MPTETIFAVGTRSVILALMKLMTNSKLAEPPIVKRALETLKGRARLALRLAT